MARHSMDGEFDYQSAIKAVSVLVDADPRRGTPEADRLEILGALVEAYEARHLALPPSTPIEVNESASADKVSISEN